MQRRQFHRSLAALWAGTTLGTLAALGTAQAQTQAQPASDFPHKPIRLVVTFPPGGSADAITRMLQPLLTPRLGQQLIIDNRPGAGGNVGLSAVATAPADGYTLGVGAAGGLAVNSSLYSQMPFDPQKDLAPITALASIPFVLIGHPSLPARNLGELIALAKTQPGALAIGHGGNGTAMHLSAALLAQLAGIRFNEVPYKGSGPAALNVLGNQVALAIVDLPSSLQHIRAGTLRAYGVTSAKRLPQLPDVPTLAEGGLPGYESIGWFGLVAPAATPGPVIERLSADFNAALRDPGVQKSMHEAGVEPAPMTPAAFGSFIRAETAKWAKVIRTANIKLD